MDRYYIGDYYIFDGVEPSESKVKMPIEWIALEDTDDGKTLLLSKNVLDAEAYCFSEGTVKWKETYIYKYLCELYQKFFTEEEKQIIVEGDLGHLFLLSKEEIIKYMPEAEQRRAVMWTVSDYDEETEIFMEHQFYWLRADECPFDAVPYVESLGNIDYFEGYADEVGIRVAMWVDTKKARILTAKKGYNPFHHFFWKYEEF